MVRKSAASSFAHEFSTRGLGEAAMTSIFILLAVSGLSGFVIGKSSSSWPALIVAGAVLATLGAVVLQEQGFTAFSRSLGASSSIRSPMCWQSDRNDDQSGGAAEDLPEQRANAVPRDGRNNDVRHKDSKNQ